MRSSLPRASLEDAGLTKFQNECIRIFVDAAAALALPKSIGEIYGLLYSSREPLCFEDVVLKLQMSKGAASQGLRWLRSINALESVYVEGDRREHFVAQTELRKLIVGVFVERVRPGLQDSDRSLSRLESAIGLERTPQEAAFARTRADRLRRWSSALNKLLPMLVRLIGKD